MTIPVIERWKTLEEDSRYRVSNFGRIQSFARKNTRTLKPWKNDFGYLFVNIGKKKYAVHQLVMKYHGPEKPKGKNVVIDHKDANTGNPRLENLEWVTQSENLKRGWVNTRRKLQAGCRGCCHHRYLHGRCDIKVCHYILDTGEPRGCSARNCSKFSDDISGLPLSVQIQLLRGKQKLTDEEFNLFRRMYTGM